MISLEKADRPLCPLQSIGQFEPVPCAGGLCAWWDRLTGFCSVFTAAEAVRFAGEQINAQNFILEEMEKDAPASVTSTDGDGVENVKTDVSASNDNRNKEDLQV